LFVAEKKTKKKWEKVELRKNKGSSKKSKLLVFFFVIKLLVIDMPIYIKYFKTESLYNFYFFIFFKVQRAKITKLENLKRGWGACSNKGEG
jgi:hypothetical protein